MSRTCHLWFLVSLPPSMTTPTGNAILFSIIWHKLLLWSHHLLQLFGSIVFPGQMASLTYEATASWFMWSVAVILIFFDVSKRQCSILDTIEFSKFFLKLFNLLFLCLNYPNILCINPDILQRWCNVPICGPTDADADADDDADADEDVDVVLEFICFSCPPTIVD